VVQAARNMSDQDEMTSLGVVKLLVEAGCNLNACDSFGLNGILTAAHSDGSLPNLPVLEFLLERNEITRIDKIDALEMAGAVILYNDENHEKFPLAFQHWRRALTLRLMDTQDCRPIHKTPLKSKSGQLSEWSTLEDIQRIEQQPAQRKIQSLLVQLRIFSSLGWSAVREHFLSSILDFLVMRPPQEGSISEILDLSWITFDTILRLDRPHESNMQDALSKVATIVILNLNDSKFNSENLQHIVEVVLMTDPSHMTDPDKETPMAETRHLKNLCVMFIILSRHAEMITEELKLTLLQLIHRDVRDPSGMNLLLTACRIPDDAALHTIRFLVKLGANLNARNNVGDGVLHILAKEPGSETRDATAQLLVDLGAHLDMANKDGKTAADLWFQKNTPEKKDVADLPDWLQEGIPKLMCLSSRVICRHKLPYDDGAIVPAVLIPFVSLH